jgi:hypothetical protein
MNNSASSRALELEQHVQDLGAHGDVEHRDRLVADDAGGLEHERRRDRHALAPAAGELVRVAVGEAPRREPDLVERALDPRRVLGLRHPGDDERLGHDVAHPPPRIERLVRVLEDHLDGAPHRAQARLPAQLGPVREHAASTPTRSTCSPTAGASTSPTRAATRCWRSARSAASRRLRCSPTRPCPTRSAGRTTRCRRCRPASCGDRTARST